MKYSKVVKKDGFYTEASKILNKPLNTGSIRMKLNSRVMVVRKPTVEPIERFKCIACFAEHNVFETNIRGRILRGYLETVDGQTHIKHLPLTNPPKPCYHNGRLCEKCFPKYGVQATSPTDYKSIQLLKDFAKNVTHEHGVTIASVEDEDRQQEIALEQVQKDARPKWQGRFAIDVGEVGNAERQRHVCTKCSNHNGTHTLKCSACGARVTTEDLKVDANAFRKFMRSRGGGVKNYEARLVNKLDQQAGVVDGVYDSAIEFTEVKTG